MKATLAIQRGSRRNRRGVEDFEVTFRSLAVSFSTACARFVKSDPSLSVSVSPGLKPACKECHDLTTDRLVPFTVY